VKPFYSPPSFKPVGVRDKNNGENLGNIFAAVNVPHCGYDEQKKTKEFFCERNFLFHTSKRSNPSESIVMQALYFIFFSHLNCRKL
jgi:hypothetical protein